MTNELETAEHIHPDLTVRQSALVENMLRGDETLRECIKNAGYASDGSGYAAWNSDKVQAVFQRACLSKLAQHVPVALKTQLHLIQSAKSEYVRLQAAQDVLDRVGLRTETERSLGNLQINIDLSG